MNKRLLLQLLVVWIFTGNQIQSIDSVTVYNCSGKPIFVKNVVPLLKTGKSGVINADQSAHYKEKSNYDGSGDINLRIFNGTSNSGAYLYISIKKDITTIDEYYNANGLAISNSWYQKTPSINNVSLYIYPYNVSGKNCENFDSYSQLFASLGLIRGASNNPKGPILNNTQSTVYFGGVGQSSELWAITPNTNFNVGMGEKFLIYPTNNPNGKALYLEYNAHNKIENNIFKTCFAKNGSIDTSLPQGPEQVFNGNVQIDSDPANVLTISGN
jgi:hypothetical protein